jgi:hypothetical protein
LTHLLVILKRTKYYNIRNRGLSRVFQILHKYKSKIGRGNDCQNEIDLLVVVAAVAAAAAL